MKNKIGVYTIGLIILLLIGVFLRFYNLEKFGTFGHDNSRDLILTYKMYKYHEWQYRGPVFSLVWAHLSFIYYYLIFPFYFLLRFSPLAPAIFTTFLNIAALVLIWFVTKEIFGKFTALIATALYAVSFEVIKEGAFGLNPCFMPMFAVLFLYGVFLKVKKNNWIGSLIISFCLAMLVSFHPSGFFVIPSTVLVLLISKQRFKLKELIYSGLIFLVLAVMPYVYQEKKFNGWDIQEVQKYLNTPKIEHLSFLTYMTNFFKILNLNISITLFYSEAILFSLVGLIIIGAIFYYAIKIYKNPDFINILAFIILSYSLLFGYVMKFSDIGLHGAWFQSVLIPWIIIFIAGFVNKINSKERYFVILIGLLLIFSQNIFNYFNYRSEEDKFYAQKAIYEKIRSDSNGQDLDIYGEDPQPFNYMLWYYEPESGLKEKYFTWIKWAKTNDSHLVYFLDTKYSISQDFMNDLYEQNNVSLSKQIFSYNGRNLFRIE